MAEKVLEVIGLNKRFYQKKKMFQDPIPPVKAVTDVNLTVYKGETLSIVGESGCGKTTLARCIVKAIDSNEGEVYYHNRDGEKIDFLNGDKKTFKKHRKDIQMIFQDPFSSLDPRMTVFDIISEPLKANFKLTKEEIEKKVSDIAAANGLNINYLRRYPHAFSGGQRQRIGIARALVTQPDIVVCDEAVSALDVSIQAQIINLLKDLQEDLGITYVFIAHDLSVVEHISDRVAVMYLGRIIEIAKTDDLFFTPKHPYSEALLSAVPKADPTEKMERIILEGEVPNPMNIPSGCHFHPRCSYATDKCKKEVPALVKIGDNGHESACHYANELNLKGV
ncbi:ATP-binding cassette domain-containing protein [Acidaminobacter sp. JC074]|uniref:ABC transporter ATP-binding protein n=1 Tax=Acidaminobacter sp. JC074 TaxID=2530199 RepID=UPI001F0D19CE|nr:oligopeptide/dipeptide ABC transporter ATP-binding protein [Acidaminobacter sp. JC074]MCH4887007.1 ATP-binding cassette domain-containing protein [Acidaminobacter sp. JC074]